MNEIEANTEPELAAQVAHLQAEIRTLRHAICDLAVATGNRINVLTHDRVDTATPSPRPEVNVWITPTCARCDRSPS
jgi:hypothetical protein